MILIKRELTLADVEDLYMKYRVEKLGKNVDLEFPNELQESTVAVLPSLLQFLITVIRENKLKDIYARFDSSASQNQIADVAKHYLWFVASSLEWTKGLKFKDGEPLRFQLRPVNQEINRLISDYLPLRSSFMMPCFDHLPKSKGLPLMFYSPDKHELVSENMIEQYVSLVLKNLGKLINKSMFAQLEGAEKALSAIIYELFKNTQEWATRDAYNDKIEPSVRGFYFKFFSNEQEKMFEYCDGNKSLQRYFSHQIFKPNTVNRISFLEISVFDSGDGFIGKRTESGSTEDIPVNQQVEIVKQCLTKYFTTASGMSKIVKGIGLDRVLRTIDQKGFFRLRTNKVCVCRDMIANPYAAESDSGNISLFDWKTGLRNDFTSFYDVKGTVVSLILPLDYIEYIPNN
jgi:hypothetical protein